MITGFGFSTPQKEVQLLDPYFESDFEALLDTWMRHQSSSSVAIDRDFLMNKPELATNLLSRYNVIVVDPSWSPLEEEVVRPFLVHRNYRSLHTQYKTTSVVVLGSLIPQLMGIRTLDSFKVYYCEDGRVKDAKIDMAKRSGWGILNTVGQGNIITSRVYKYREERDYELESKKK